MRKTPKNDKTTSLAKPPPLDLPNQADVDAAFSAPKLSTALAEFDRYYRNQQNSQRAARIAPRLRGSRQGQVEFQWPCCPQCTPSTRCPFAASRFSKSRRCTPMTKAPKKGKKAGLAKRPPPSPPSLPTQADLDAVLGLIEAARSRAVSAANRALVDLYWSIGQHISRRIAEEGWGRGTVEALAEAIQRRYPTISGYSASNLWRMQQFYETYRHQPELATLLRELPWSHNLAIMSRSKRDQEREFYLRTAIRERWSFRDLQRQLAGALFERTVLSPPKLSPAVTELHPAAAVVFKDAYLVEFLDLPLGHTEGDLQGALVEKLKAFLIELGRDFCFIGSQYPLPVGRRDFVLDLLFFNRALNCLVAIELKIDQFQPEHLGKLEFYLEALDRDVKKAHERPSIGVLLCATRDHKVVEYALSRAVSPALVAEYQTRLPDKKLLESKLHEFYELAHQQAALAAMDAKAAKPTVRGPTRPRKRRTK